MFAKITSENMLNFCLCIGQGRLPKKVHWLPPNLPKVGSVRRMGYHFCHKRTASKASAHGYDHSFPGNRDLLRKSEFKLLPRSSEVKKSKGRGATGTGVWTPPCKLVVISSVVKSYKKASEEDQTLG